MVTTRMLGGLVLAASVAVGPASAQLWPNGGGPSGDVLRNSQEQWQRLAPPPVDAERVASLPIPPVESRVDVGTPVLALPDQPVPRVRTAPTTTRQGVRRTSARRAPARRGTSRGTIVRSTDEDRLERDIAVRQRRMDELQRQIESDRARLEQRRGGGMSSLNPVPPAAAGTLAPSAPPPTATLR